SNGCFKSDRLLWFDAARTTHREDRTGWPWWITSATNLNGNCRRRCGCESATVINFNGRGISSRCETAQIPGHVASFARDMPTRYSPRKQQLFGEGHDRRKRHLAIYRTVDYRRDIWWTQRD